MNSLATSAVTGIVVSGGIDPSGALSQAVESFVECKAEGAAKIGVESTLQKTGNQRFGKVPTGVTKAGETVVGRYGERTNRREVKYVTINGTRENLRAASRERNSELFTKMPGDSQQRQQYLDNAWIQQERAIQDLRTQYDLYGHNSREGRLIEQELTSRTWEMSQIERAAGVRDGWAGNATKQSGNTRDFGYVPDSYAGQGGFGERVRRGEMGEGLRTQLQHFSNLNQDWRSDFWDNEFLALGNNNTEGLQANRSNYINRLQNKVEYTVYQLDLYRGTAQERYLQTEILRDMRLMRDISIRDTSYQSNFNSTYERFGSVLPNSMRNQL
ncbi:hypothetical protein [Laspinema palackyanum]|uniref:hypothetical protein n=1 Tax=Laspinema palackyanum TaxID=3231601 RepID=UPI00345C659F|nr:hypothetical protein [Laspinema sp. D2c]